MLLTALTMLLAFAALLGGGVALRRLRDQLQTAQLDAEMQAQQQQSRQREVEAELQDLRAERDELDQRVTALEQNLHEHLAIEFVVSSLLIEKGLIEEHELQETHRRLVLEPALLNEEHEALLEELAEPDTLRQRLVRNLPATLQ